MEVDLVVTRELQPTELKVIFDTRILFSATNGSNEAEGIAPISAFAPTKVTDFLMKPLIKHFPT
jgi:hypothetical protein